MNNGFDSFFVPQSTTLVEDKENEGGSVRDGGFDSM